MGFIRVITGGSFKEVDMQFGAISHGHAHAVAKMIQFLSEEVLPDAISQDHYLHEMGDTPRHGFNHKDKK